MKCIVSGSGGMIGGHLVKALLDRGDEVRTFDIKHKKDWWQWHPRAQNVVADCRHITAANLEGADCVFDLAENMGGIHFITNNRIDCAESIEIGINMLRESVRAGVQRFFFASSACVYNTALQVDDEDYQGLGGAIQLRESDAWPALPEEGYGFSKLYMEELCKHYATDTGLEVRIARYHNVFGEHSTWNDGKEKAPAAMCRKIAEAVIHGEGSIDIWGNGKQLRSFLHIDDCVRGTIALMESDYDKPINIGSDRSVTIDGLATIIEEIAGVSLHHNHIDGAVGVDARNADLTLVKQVLGWEPEVSLEDGLRRLYEWIFEQVALIEAPHPMLAAEIA